MAEAPSLSCTDKLGACASRTMPRLSASLHILCHAANPEPSQDPQQGRAPGGCRGQAGCPRAGSHLLGGVHPNPVSQEGLGIDRRKVQETQQRMDMYIVSSSA